MRKFLLSLLLISVAVIARSLPAWSRDLPTEQIKVPPGFRIEVFTDNVENARSLALGEKGTIFVGTRSAGKVYAVIPGNGTDRAERVITIASGLNMPNGIVFRDRALYIAEETRVIRYDDIEARLSNPPRPVVVNESLPRQRDHGWRYMAAGPDGMLYLGVGAPCNVCESEDERFATIMRMKKDGSGMEIFAKGIRNSVGMDWDPVTKSLWFTDNGRDWMGDNRPPDELNHAPKEGMNFGFPYCHGGDLPDPEFGRAHACSEFTPPAMKLGPHVAALGMRFYTGKMFPEAYHHQVFIAEHGSWNRSVPIGYRVTMVTLDKERNPVRYDVFAEGWLRGGKPWGRPVDLLVMPDGALLISDDKAGAIYRITYGKK